MCFGLLSFSEFYSMQLVNKKIRFKADQQMIVLLISLLIFVVFSFFLPNFFSTGNLIAMMRSIAVLAIASNAG